jgi:hypothetical protein
MAVLLRVDVAGASDVRTATEAADARREHAPAHAPRQRWQGWRWRTGVEVAVLSLALAVPLVVALAVLRTPTWHPLSDAALIEMRVRDVGTRHSPLVGPYGRITGLGETGSHPGPLMFYALWPLYRLAGADGWALELACAAAAFAAAVVGIWIGHRRGGLRLALAVTAVLVLLARAYGFERLAEAWNPHLPLLWWVVFLLAAWSVACGDLPLLPVAVFAGTFCVQCHIGYVGLVGGLLAAVAVAVVVAIRVTAAPSMRRTLGWAALSVGLGALLWLPPIVDQAINQPGNLAVLVENFRHPPVGRPPFDQVAHAWISHLDPTELATTHLSPRGSAVPGLVLLVVWLAAAGLARRHRHVELVRLHLVVGGAAALGLVSMSRVLGPIWPYLTLWAWGTTAVMVLAVVWTALALAPPALHARAPAVLAGTTLVLAALFTVDARSAELRDAPLSRSVDRLAAATEARLREDPAGCRDRCRYQVSWEDPRYLGSQGYSMVVELARRGFDVGAPPREAPHVGQHHAVDDREADAIIRVVVTDRSIESARSLPDSEELAYVDPGGGYHPAAVFLQGHALRHPP